MVIDDETKQRIKDSIQSFTDKNKPKAGPTRTNDAPEKEVEREALTWLRANGFHVNVVESKATWSRKHNRYINQSTTPGFADIVGNDRIGRACFIELKAPGRRANLRPGQRDFLLSKIETGCFAVCVDSVELLKNQYEHFSQLVYRKQMELSKDFLKAALPKEKVQKDDGPLFPEE